MINDLKVWPVSFDPSWYFLQHPLQMAVVVSDNGAGDPRRSVHVIVLQFSGGDIKLALQPCEQRFEPAAFLFQGIAAGKMDFDRDDGDVHALSLDRKMHGHKEPLHLIYNK